MDTQLHVMRYKIILATTFLLTLSTACDDRVIDAGQASQGNHGGSHGCAEPEPEPHPYLSCDQDMYDPVCEIGCGQIVNGEGDGHMFCAIPCDDNADCAFVAGPGPAECVDHRCYYFCDDDADCHDDLECVSRGDLLPNDPYPSGECMAPYSEP